MSGQLLRAKSAKEPKPKHTHVVFTFTQGGELRYVDPRTFGELFVSTPPPGGRDSRPRRVGQRRVAGGHACRSARPCPSWPTSASTPSRT